MTTAPQSVPLAEELAQLKKFVEVLREEQEALSVGAVDTLMRLVEYKSALALQLGNLAKQREDMLGAAGFGLGREAVDAWLADTPGTTVQRKTWQELLELTMQARNLNETNGKLINLRMQHNQQALAVLMAAADKAMTYGPDGQQRTGGTGRFLGSA